MIQNPARTQIAIIGGGPAGLMAADVAARAGLQVDLFEQKASVGRKFLIAGRGGLNLTHSDPFERFASRYFEQNEWVRTWLERFHADDLRDFATELGIDTFVGSSGRVFPTDMKAAPMLRSWVHRLRDRGVRMHMRHRWTDLDADGRLHFDHDGVAVIVRAEATILALGGASWPQLGSDGRFVEILRKHDVDIAPWQSANCGFEVDWSPHLKSKFAGQALKRIALALDADTPSWQQGECVIAEYGLEGSAIYALSKSLRERIGIEGRVRLLLDLVPGTRLDRLRQTFAHGDAKRSLSDRLRRSAHLDPTKIALVQEVIKREPALAHDIPALIKALPIELLRPRPIAEAISSAGGVARSALDTDLMLKQLPGIYCVGEMLDWEAPTGGYLLTASMASAVVAAQAAVHRVQLAG